MSHTIQSIDSNLRIRYDILQKLISTYVELLPSETDMKLMYEYSYELEKQRDEYYLGCINYLDQYCSMVGDEKQNDIYKKYTKFVMMGNFIANIDIKFDSIKSILDKYEIPEKKVYNEFCVTFGNAVIDIETVERTSNNCPTCGKLLTIEPATSENVCIQCNFSEQIHGVVYEDEQFFYQDGPRTKHGKYDPSKHCRSWLEAIQALKSVNTDDWDDKIVKPIKKLIERDNIARPELISYKIIRGYLKELDLPSYNEHIPLIRKLTIGIDPAKLTSEESRAVISYFSIAIQLYVKLKLKSKPNCIYYPYLLYKIIQNVLKDPADKKRCREILSCIHLQKSKTLIAHDKIWQDICPNIHGFVYTPTDPSDLD
jgi:hypothetical protein